MSSDHCHSPPHRHWCQHKWNEDLGLREDFYKYFIVVEQ